MINNKTDLKDKVIVITGAGSGIGRATALLLAKTGAKLVLMSKDIERLETLSSEIKLLGKDPIIAPVDISRESEVVSSMEFISKKWDTIDGVFANAGINGVWAPISDIKVDDFLHTLKVNLIGSFLTIKSALPYMKKKGGSVVITSSINGNRNFRNSGSTAYSCSKAAQVAMMKLLAVELAEYEIRINAICPGAIDTNISQNTEKKNLEDLGQEIIFPEGQIPLTGKQPGTPEEVAETVKFLLSDQSNHITGTELYIDGGQSLL